MKEIIKPNPGIICGPKAIIILTKPDFAFFKKYFSLPHKKTLFLSEIYFDQNYTLAGPALGAPQAAILLENLIQAGVKECLIYGWAGSLKREIPLGEFFWIKKALSAEGTSHFYLDKPFYLAPLSSDLKRLSQKNPLSWVTTVTIDALYRETEDFIEIYRQKAMLIDMEIAALYSIAQFRNIHALALLGVSDIVYPKIRRNIKKLLGQREKLCFIFESFFQKDKG